jgi:hypothetical protein
MSADDFPNIKFGAEVIRTNNESNNGEINCAFWT